MKVDEIAKMSIYSSQIETKKTGMKLVIKPPSKHANACSVRTPWSRTAKIRAWCRSNCAAGLKSGQVDTERETSRAVLSPPTPLPNWMSEIERNSKKVERKCIFLYDWVALMSAMADAQWQRLLSAFDFFDRSPLVSPRSCISVWAIGTDVSLQPAVSNICSRIVLFYQRKQYSHLCQHRNQMQTMERARSKLREANTNINCLVHISANDSLKWNDLQSRAVSSWNIHMYSFPGGGCNSLSALCWIPFASNNV